MLRLTVATLVGFTMLSSAVPAEASTGRDAGSVVSLHGRARTPAVSLDDLLTRYELAQTKVVTGPLDKITALIGAERVPTFPAMTGRRIRPVLPKVRRRRGPITFDSTLPLPITRGDR